MDGMIAEAQAEAIAQADDEITGAGELIQDALFTSAGLAGRCRRRSPVRSG